MCIMVEPTKLGCNHRFCHQCMQRVLRIKKSCPLCRGGLHNLLKIDEEFQKKIIKYFGDEYNN